MTLPIVRRALRADTRLSADLHPVLDRVYRARDINDINELNTSAKALLHYEQLRDIDKATTLLVDALKTQKKITIVGDFDADGATSTAVCILALKQMGFAHISYLVPNRFDFGYGLSKQIVDVALQQGAEVIVTVDNGIACFDGVAHARALGLRVIVTDHHLPAPSLPDADAIVNPNRKDCGFASKSIAGVGVAFYLMLALRAKLQREDWFTPSRPAPNLANLLDIVAVGTVADVVSLDKNNRVLVYQGLQRIRSGQCRPGIKALFEVANRNKPLAYLTATDLGFVIGPRLNAAGRLEDMALGIECLLCDDPLQARHMASELDRLNLQRRAIENEMKEEAEAALASISVEGELPPALVLYQPHFHQGVVGIVAGRLKEKHHRPVIVFANQNEREIKGSARSIPGLHIRDILDEVNTAWPGVIDKFGGHAMAAGLSLTRESLPVFEAALHKVTRRHLNGLDSDKVILSDGELSADDLALDLAHTLRQAGPFGQGFDAPLFDGIMDVVDQRMVGENKNHLKLVLRKSNGEEVDAIAFSVDTTVWPSSICKRVQVAYRLDINTFRGRESLQLLIEEIEPVE
ncbi:single-stranded-DNA-specific exonuclease RecJ [Aestuariibacter sp. A3R04]|uniref:single-stranded-DNA-specific exonuclease RecJ n=1 Tax=Aestuariibacter sp. A3R04 TaxID=2841571 RepID=UPI001C0A3303|nr:single-stranded-DNA-specific exonuclease RecJ [Aestuariibacter sp. A3R04]MBU3020967.1 single-stranded-DNA-specific exonuclease RecJ [Aestuariibacter sp. A3R04]